LVLYATAALRVKRLGYAVRFVDMPAELATRIEAALRRLNEE
jgi:hypothetical protein